LWERSDRIERCDPGEGSLSNPPTLQFFSLADTDPSSVADFVRATFSHKGRRFAAMLAS
jgi:hypothetical protein